MLTGKKTYLIGAATFLYGALGYFLGYMEANDAAQMVFVGSGLSALRAGIKRG